ncbi:TPA: hypothetical protein N0F65_010564, partial [Lagenidium giganteum]
PSDPGDRALDQRVIGSSPPAVCPSSEMSCWVRACDKLIHAWEATQVELHGQYSLRRLQEFQAYRSNASWFRVVAVVLLTPLPVLTLILLTDAIPLQSPREGLVSSHTFWVRVWITAFIMCAALLEQVRASIPTLPIKSHHAAALTLCNCAVGTTFAFAMACVVGYPVPLTIPAIAIPWAISFTANLWWFLHRHFRDHPEDMNAFRQLIPVVLVQTVQSAVYPAYRFIFVHLSPNEQIAFAALLPIIKIAAKNAFAYVMRGKDDLKPEAVILNVEVFSALLMVGCMQGATTIYSSLVLMSADFIHSCLSLRDLHTMLKNVPDGAKRGQSLVGGAFWLDQAIFLCNGDPSLADNKGVSDRSQLRKSRKSRWHRQFRTQVQPSDTVGEPICRPQCAQTNHQNCAVEAGKSWLIGAQVITSVPTEISASSPPIESSFAEVAGLATTQKKLFVVQTLRILYLLEFVLLVEFTETIVPVIYSLFVLMVLRLPNREHYSHFIAPNDDVVFHQLRNVFSYSALEWGSLVILQLMLRRYVRLSPIQLLAFVLEKQAKLVQSHMMVWFFFTISMMLDHFGTCLLVNENTPVLVNSFGAGTDFSFQFKWLSEPHST